MTSIVLEYVELKCCASMMIFLKSIVLGWILLTFTAENVYGYCCIMFHCCLDLILSLCEWVGELSWTFRLTHYWSFSALVFADCPGSIPFSKGRGLVSPVGWDLRLPCSDNQTLTKSTVLSAQVTRHPIMLQLSAAVRGPKDRVSITHTCSTCLVCHSCVIDTAVGYALV